MAARLTLIQGGQSAITPAEKAGSKGTDKTLDPTPPGRPAQWLGGGLRPGSEYFPKQGERALSIGKTGSGKTLFNRWLLERIPDSPMIIYDTKFDPKFDQLPNSAVASNYDEVYAAMDHLGVDYIIIRPPPLTVYNPRALDTILLHHEENWRGVPAYIDELYHFHRNGYAGPGLSGLYTRGRARGITTIGSTQRPAHVSQFVFSESDLFYLFRLSKKDDRKKVENFVPEFGAQAIPPKYHFYVKREESDDPPVLMPPVPVDKNEKLGYTDQDTTPQAANSGADGSVETKERPVNIWIG